MTEPKSHELLKQYQAGDSEAASAIFDRYVERLIALARARIGPKLKRRLDPEDIVQSAYRSFFVHAKNQDYQLTRSGDLWRLLASMTLKKLYGQIEKQTAAKRSIDRELSEDSRLANLITRDPAVVEIVAIGEQLRLILDGLSHDERLVLTSTLQGQSVKEISRLVGKSERTVRRLLDRAKQHFEQRLLREKDVAPTHPANTRFPEIELRLRVDFSDYILKDLLGSGGMGKVYRATDKRNGKIVAVKALHKSRQSDERAVLQFVQEAQILARLSHTNIVGVQGLGRFPAGGYFIVMDFVDGKNLQSRLEEGPLPRGEVVSIVQQVANAIQHAHDHGIVHCDLKPGNVLVDSSNHVFVTDFGFAFILAKAARTTTIGGTAGYIAPEILHSQSPPTCATDIYSLGVLLWALTSGRLPKESDSLPVNDGTVSIESICARCLADKPSKRYPQVSDLIGDLIKLGT